MTVEELVKKYAKTKYDVSVIDENSILFDGLAQLQSLLAEHLALSSSEPVIKYGATRYIPKDTKEIWGYLLQENEPPRDTLLYLANPINTLLQTALLEIYMELTFIKDGDGRKTIVEVREIANKALASIESVKESK
jgi:hypothetical protein